MAASANVDAVETAVSPDAAAAVIPPVTRLSSLVLGPWQAAPNNASGEVEQAGETADGVQPEQAESDNGSEGSSDQEPDGSHVAAQVAALRRAPLRNPEASIWDHLGVPRGRDIGAIDMCKLFLYSGL